jgi:hypothetical protein
MEKGCRPGFGILMVRNPVDALLYSEGKLGLSVKYLR